jgi:hypothetical protein
MALCFQEDENLKGYDSHGVMSVLEKWQKRI